MASSPVNIYGDTANAVLNTARSRIDDIILTPAGAPVSGSDPGLQLTQVGGGNLLTETNADGSVCLRTQVIFNSAYRKLQKFLASYNYRLLMGNAIIANFPASTGDIGQPSWISWNGSFNGTSLSGTPALPSDLYQPLNVRERIAGSGAAFTPMTRAVNGLLNVSSRSALNRQWIWQNNGLYMPGSSGAVDLQIYEYVKFLPDIVAAGSPAVPWYYQQVPIPGCLSSLAWYIAYEVCVPRLGEQQSAGILANAEAEANLIINDQSRSDQQSRQINRTFGMPGSQDVGKGNGQ